LSHFEIDATQHDIFLSLAINTFLTAGGGRLLFTDGGLAFRAHCSVTPPILNGYRPDAIIVRQTQLWLIEVKSFEDLASSHTSKQLANIRNLMIRNEEISLNLFIFGDRHRNVTVPRELVDLVGSDRLIINHTPLNVGAAQ